MSLTLRVEYYQNSIAMSCCMYVYHQAARWRSRERMSKWACDTICKCNVHTYMFHFMMSYGCNHAPPVRRFSTNVRQYTFFLHILFVSACQHALLQQHAHDMKMQTIKSNPACRIELNRNDRSLSK